ncbi:major facilitator superfamily domain-containing protein [Halteromyces radiatus]|uniref:major facilitator superfamily domain-containing protein n=1 Tax=Halteromyces radiatus TaxID=101107 RepID=UPI00221F7B72|nr:major facilitator superfamily domain-containing protein [Halteromyces radiatus]KAI8076367.1 major facilitator superfamily domain-containing protein [Halteromyces radiatus]
MPRNELPRNDPNTLTTMKTSESFFSKSTQDSIESVGCTIVENEGKMEQDQVEKGSCHVPRTYPQAWMVLFFLVLLRTSVQVFQFTFSVVPTITSEFFHVSLSAVNWLANIQGLVYVIISFFTGWIFEKLGVKPSLIIAGCFISVGATLRYVAVILQPPSFALAMVGQTIGAISDPLSLNIMTMFVSTWFTENRRATAGMCIAVNLGAILGLFMIPNIVKQVNHIPMNTLIIALIAGGSTIPLVFMPAKPPTPPTLKMSGDDKETFHQKPSFFQGLKLLCKNIDFWLLFLIHGLNVGLSVAFSTVFTQIISPFGYTDAQAGQLNAVAFFAGTLGCAVAGPVLDKTKQHILFLKLIAPMVLITDLGFVFMIQRDAFASVLFVTCLNQFFLSFLVPVVVELGSETSYPVAEASSNSLLWQGSQIFGFVFVLIMDSLRASDQAFPPRNMFNALVFQAATAGVMMILSLLFRGRMTRSEAIQQQQMDNHSSAASILTMATKT